MLIELVAVTTSVIAGTSTEREWRFIRVEDSEGVVGFGECTGSGPRETAVPLLLALLGALPLGAGGLDDRAQVLAFADRVAAGLPAEVHAISVVGGLEQALADLAARRAGVTLRRWLGGDDDGRSVELYANINRAAGGRTPGEMAEVAERAVRDGFAAIKCAPFDVPDPDAALADAGVRRLRAVRAAIGPAVGLLADCHGRLELSELRRIMPELEDLRLGWLEDGARFDDIEGLRAVRGMTSLTVAAAEFARTPDELRPALDEGLLDVVMPDVKHCGGVTRALALIDAAAPVAASPHNPTGPISTAVSAQLCAAAAPAAVLEYAYGEVEWRNDLVFGGEQVKDGRLWLNDRPGIGIDLDMSHPRCNPIFSLTIEET
jgi:galactonate dehydratase